MAQSRQLSVLKVTIVPLDLKNRETVRPLDTIQILLEQIRNHVAHVKVATTAMMMLWGICLLMEMITNVQREITVPPPHGYLISVWQVPMQMKPCPGDHQRSQIVAFAQSIFIAPLEPIIVIDIRANRELIVLVAQPGQFYAHLANGVKL